ncbi:hypothetical protein BMS3Abin04_02117 [bacterium BMS3Abin04]|nr:hypothetical protein BMS3Abin04_02117 [bacterium BMS3Abin04]
MFSSLDLRSILSFISFILASGETAEVEYVKGITNFFSELNNDSLPET